MSDDDFQPVELEMPMVPISMDMPPMPEMPMMPDMPPMMQEMEKQIEHAVEEMNAANPFNPDEMPHLEFSESDVVEEKMLKNGHQVREEVIETPDRKVIKVTEEGTDANDPHNVQEVKDEMTNEFKQIQPTLKPGDDEAIKIHEETHTNDKG